MNARDQIGAERGMHRAVALKTAEPVKIGRAQPDMEMCLPPFAPAGVATMLLAFIFDGKCTYGKGHAQPALDFVDNRICRRHDAIALSDPCH